MPELPKTAVLLLNFNLKDMTDALVAQIQNSTKAPYELFLLDNGSTPSEVSSSTTNRLETNVGLNAGTDFLYELVKDDDSFEFYWFLCNDLVLDDGVDYLSSLVELFTDAAKSFHVAAVSPSYHPDELNPQPPFMISQAGSEWRPIVYLEWNAVLIHRSFMLQHFPNGFALPTKHALHDVVLTFEAWNNNQACIVSDKLALRHIGNQTFLQHGGKTVNGVLVPDYAGLEDMLVADWGLAEQMYQSRNIDIMGTRAEQHRDIDIRGDWIKYVNGFQAQPPSRLRRLARRIRRA